MKLKFVILAAIIFAVTAVGFGQSKTKTLTPDAVVKDLYAAHKANRGPFFQKKSRALVDKYFTGELADLIWKDAVGTKKGEVGALDFDPLYYAQDTQITNFVIAKADENNTVKVRFKNMGKDEEITFSLTTANASSKVYKIDSIVYSDAEDLESILSASVNDDGKPVEPAAFEGDYMVGAVKCNVTSNLSGYWARVKCDDQDVVQIIDTETMTFGTFNPAEKGRRGKFVLAEDGSISKYVDAAGKEIAVSRIK
jgi:hypothetical protein